MSHKLVVGRTEFGKTRACKILAGGLVKKGKVLAYDVLGSKWPDGVVVCVDRDEFLFQYWSETDWVAVFIDESGETVKHFDEEMEKTATRGRHPGHQNFYIVQSLTLMSGQARKQCTGVFLFNCEAADADRLYDGFGKPHSGDDDPFLSIFDATAFESGEFIYFTVTTPPVKYKVNFPLNTIERDAMVEVDKNVGGTM